MVAPTSLGKRKKRSHSTNSSSKGLLRALAAGLSRLADPCPAALRERAAAVAAESFARAWAEADPGTAAEIRMVAG